MRSGACWPTACAPATSIRTVAAKSAPLKWVTPWSLLSRIVRSRIEMTTRVGLIGWRGMVGSVLRDRMRAERDFALTEPVFFTTSQAGAKAPDFGKEPPPLKDARDLRELKALEILISC